MPSYYTHIESSRIFLDKNEFYDHPQAREVQDALDGLCRWGRSDYDSVNSIGWEFRPEHKADAIKMLERFGFEQAIDE